MPNELIAAARVDGCNTGRVFWHVMLPAVRPMAAVLGLLTFMNTWNDFFWPFIVLNARNPTVQVAVSDAGRGYMPDYSLILTGCSSRSCRCSWSSSCSAGRSSAGSCRGRSRDDHERQAERLHVGRGDRGLPDRGRDAVDGRGESIWDRFAATPAGS